MQQLLPAIAKAFGLPGDRLQARLYKLLLYGANGAAHAEVLGPNRRRNTFR